MLDFIKQYWKLILLLAYSIAIPLYFYQSTKNMQKGLDSSRDSSQHQIDILKTSMQQQTVAYEKMFNDYREATKQEEIRYKEEIEYIKKTQVLQQKQLSKRFKENPSEIDKTLIEKYGLNAH